MLPRISFSPCIVNITSRALHPTEQNIQITVSPQEPIISPQGSDIGLRIKFESSIPGITITDAYWQYATPGSVPTPVTVTLKVPPNLFVVRKDIITSIAISNSELYSGYVPKLTVNIHQTSIGSMYTNNSMVYHKPGSVSSGIGGVRNHRVKGRKT